MPIVDLLQALEREAEAEIAAVLEAGRAERDALRAEAARRRAERDRVAVDAHRATVQARADAEIAAAARRASAGVLGARAAMLARLRAAIERRLPGLVDDALLAELERAVRDAAPGEVTVTREATGLRGEADGGRVTIDATLGAALARWWPRLAIEAVR